jgi:chromate reductase, NAD(P)H dehydrogenase (quinone)
MAIVKKKQVLAISGSTRQHSTNYHLIKAIEALLKGDFNVKLFEGIGNLPQFNPDINKEDLQNTVIAFRKMIAHAAAVIICTPEYAHGVPGSLKNAIDWTVSSNEFSQKPTALITASTDGRYAHGALLETLRVIEAKNVDQHQLLIQFAKTKINGTGQITDVTALAEITALLGRLKETIAQKEGSVEHG